MPLKILACGASVLLDAEDFDLVDGRSWHIYPIKPKMTRAVARSDVRNNRIHRLMLHREIMFRIKPELIKKRCRVFAINGNYLDCRRVNLEVALARPKRGRKRDNRPTGWARGPSKRPVPAEPGDGSSWVAAPRRRAVRRDPHL